MTRDEIIKMARAVGWDEMGADLWGAAFDGAMSIYALERFAALVAAAEREQCAILLENYGLDLCPGDKDVQRYRERTKPAREYYAAAIRARN